MIDIAAIKARAAQRMAGDDPAKAAKAANWLTADARISQLATLATTPTASQVQELATLASSSARGDTTAPAPLAAHSPEAGREGATARESCGDPCDQPVPLDQREPAWTDADIAAFESRRVRLLRWGYQEDAAEKLAARLVERDRDEDDRRTCLECSHLGDQGRCLAAAAGRISGADRRLEPIPDLLQRCPAFGLKKGLR